MVLPRTTRVKRSPARSKPQGELDLQCIIRFVEITFFTLLDTT